jgi:hypothetical protein
MYISVYFCFCYLRRAFIPVQSGALFLVPFYRTWISKHNPSHVAIGCPLFHLHTLH